MKYLLKFSLLSILRRKLKTILTLIVIAFGMVMYIAFAGLIRGLQDKRKETPGFETAHLKIRSGNFNETRPYSISNFITNYRKIENAVSSKKYVIAFDGRISFVAPLTYLIQAPVDCERNDLFVSSVFPIKATAFLLIQHKSISNKFSLTVLTIHGFLNIINTQCIKSNPWIPESS